MTAKYDPLGNHTSPAVTAFNRKAMVFEFWFLHHVVSPHKSFYTIFFLSR